MPKKVLIIDDDPILRAVLEDGLRGFGFKHFLIAANGLEATKVYSDHADDIILMTCDLHMPDFDGIEFVGYLSRQRARCPIIFVSSADNAVRHAAKVLAKAGDLKVVGSLRKPIDFAALNVLVGDLAAAA